MIFSIFVILVVLAIAFFHYVQGFFSATLSAVLSIVSAVIALSYYESIVEGPLGGIAPNWMPTLVLLGLFAVSYVLLRTIFDKVIPGGMQLPAVVDKVGGGLMGIVAGVFGAGVMAVAAQQLPFMPALGGYARYEVTDVRAAAVPSSSAAGRPTEAATYDEMVGDTFNKDNEKRMLFPVDDIVVGTVAHLSDAGSLSAGKPLKSVHPDLLQELFGQRLGIEKESNRAAVNLPSKGKNAVEGVAVFRAPPLGEAQIVDHEFKRMRSTPLKHPKPTNDEIRVVVRLRFDESAVEPKDKKLRISPGAVRLVAKQQSMESDGLEPVNYYPIGTLEPNGVLYANRIDDFLIIDVPAKTLQGDGSADAEVDFVFQVKKTGFLKDEATIEPGTFVEVKKFARVELGDGSLATVKPNWSPLPMIAVRRKQLNFEEGGLKPLVAGKGGAVAAAAPTADPGGGELGKRLAGSWETRTGVRVSETITFAANGTMTSEAGNGTKTEYRWAASGAPQGDMLTIDTTLASDPTKTEKRTVTFTGDAEFTLGDASGANRRFTRVGSAPAEAAASPTPTPPAANSAAPNEVMSKLIGTWSSDIGLSYTFHGDGTYAANQAATETAAARSAVGTWTVKAVAEPLITLELIPPSKKTTEQKWELGAAGSNEMTRISGQPETRTLFRRTS